MKKYIRLLSLCIFCTLVICLGYHSLHLYYNDCTNCEMPQSSMKTHDIEHYKASENPTMTKVATEPVHCDSCDKPQPLERVHNATEPQLTREINAFHIRDYSEIMHKCRSECIKDGFTSMPKTVFLVKTDSTWTYTEWITVLSIHKYIKPDIIYIVSRTLIEPNCWWNRTLEVPKVMNIIPESSKWVTTIRTVTLVEPAHVCDFMKTTVLYEMGGILMDTDAIAIKSFDELLLNHQVVLARDQGGFVVNGLMLAQKRSCFMCNFVINSYHRFNGKWNTHSTWTLNPVWKGYKDVLILNQYEGFFPFSPNEIRLQNFLSKDKAGVPDDVSRLYAVHLYHNLLNTNEVFQKIKEQTIDTYSWLKDSKSFGAEVFRSVVPQGFTSEHFNTSIACLHISYS